MAAPPPAISTKFGCRLPLVLAKLGFDLRSQLDDTFSAPIPARIQRLADQVDGHVEWRDVGPEPRASSAEERSTDEIWREFVEADQPFRFTWADGPLLQQDVNWP